MASQKSGGGKIASPAPLAPPTFEAQNCINGIHIVRLRAPQFGKDPKLVETRIERDMLHDVKGKNGRDWDFVGPQHIVVRSKPGKWDGKLVLDNLVPCGLFFYKAVAVYEDGSIQKSYSVTPVIVP